MLFPSYIFLVHRDDQRLLFARSISHDNVCDNSIPLKCVCDMDWVRKKKIIFMEKLRLKKVVETIQVTFCFIPISWPVAEIQEFEVFINAWDSLWKSSTDPYFFSGIASVHCLGLEIDWCEREIRVNEKDGDIERLKITLLFALRYLRN